MFWYYVSADFRLVKSEETAEKICISFNNTYSLTVQSNNTVIFEVSENTKDWLPLQAYIWETEKSFLKNRLSDYPILQ